MQQLNSQNYPTVAKLLMLKRASNLQKHVKWHHSTNVLGKKTYDDLYTNEGLNPNPSESVPEAITVIEIISSKPNDAQRHMYEDTWICTGHVQWMLNISSPDNLSQLILELQCWAYPKISDFQEELLTSITWNRVSNRYRHRKYFTITQMPTNTNTPAD
jgi:hypothetical protein